MQYIEDGFKVFSAYKISDLLAMKMETIHRKASWKAPVSMGR